MPLISMEKYMEILKHHADGRDVDLRLAFIEAGVPTSTFYRARVGKELRYKTALKVLESIDKLSSLQENN
jgi:predicted transcriptional regulator